MLDGRLVTQLQCLAWPDHGAPEEHDYKVISGILQVVRDHHKAAAKIVIHCSAGIGRTGSLIAIYNLQLAATKLQTIYL